MEERRVKRNIRREEELGAPGAIKGGWKKGSTG
jgi:hypothetical protein